MKLFRRLSAWLLTVLVLTSLCVFPAEANAPTVKTTILFTHDLHSHFLQQPVADGESGGYARLKTAIDTEREKHAENDVLLLDGGDFSIGSLIHTLTTTHAPELRLMGQMGYDATTIGNHEFDHESAGLARMLYAAKDAQAAAMRVMAESVVNGPLAQEYEKQYGPLTWALPPIVMSNYKVSEDNPDREFVQQALDNYGVGETLIIERNGVKYGIFGLMGVDAHECAPTSGFTPEDVAMAAKRCVAELKAQGAQFIICLSHAGTGETLQVSEDEELAKAVDGIDVILSGHTHTVLDEPIVVNGTYIISAGPYSENLGVLTVEWKPTGERELVDYRLVPIDETLAEDAEIAANVEQLKALVGEEYLARYGLTYDQVLTGADFALKDPNYSAQSGNNLGELIADSFLWAVENLEADAPDVETVSVTACGVIRAALPAGDLTTSQAFDVLSMGVGSDGTSGFPLVAVYLTGEELKAAAEVDASVTPIMPAAQLYMGGIQYSFNVHRMFFNRITETQLCEAPFVNDFTGSGLTQIEDDQLYRVVTGMYSAQMLGAVKSKSMGLLSLEPKMADGTPVTDFDACILRDKDGNEIKEWYALAAYLQQFGEDGVQEWYADPLGDGRKTVSRSWNPVEHLVNLKWITGLAIGIILVTVLAVALTTRAVTRKRRKKKD